MAKPKPTTIQTREALECAMGDLAQATIRRGKVALDLETRLQNIRKAFETPLAELDDEIEALVADLEAWAALHKEEFADRKSLALIHGVLGFRTGNPTLKTVKGVKWDHVLALLKSAGMRGYIRASEEVDKETILAHREGIGAAKLAALGMRVDQEERFYVEPRQEQQA